MFEMKKYTILFLVILAIGACNPNKKQQIITDMLIDFDWKFHLGDVSNGQDPGLDTESWKILDLPHDWSIEGEYSQNHGTDWQTGFLPAGIAWYRKVLNWNPDWKDKRVKIHFEGVYLNSDVWINGHHLGHHPNGYVGFEYDISDYLKKGNNEIAVKVDHSKPLTGRWYTGSGIYRHVWLKVKNPIHIATDGIFFTTPVVEYGKTDFQASVSVENQSDFNSKVKVILFLKDKNGQIVAEGNQAIDFSGKETRQIEFKKSIKNPMLWSPDSPDLYSLTVQLKQDEEIIDQHTQKVGFRKLEFNSEFGFKLNGKVTKLKGVCEHHTAGSVGAAVPDDVWLYRLKLLKQMGCNAIRNSHNPFSPAFYNICDSIGIMVMNEFLDGWDVEKAAHDYGLYFEENWAKDAEAFIKRDRNHPSVIMWSIGNEVRKARMEVQKELIDLFHHFDSTRKVTQGGHDPTRGMKGDKLRTQLDIKGFNGNGEEIGEFEKFHSTFPDVPMVGTEIPHTYQTRGVYRSQTHWRRRDFPAMWEVNNGGKMGNWIKRIVPISDLAKSEVFSEDTTTNYYKNGRYYPIENDAPWSKVLYHQSSYDNASVRTSARVAWQRTRDLDYVMGQFRWGSFDYLGETNNWPSRFANFGVIDICGFPKDHFYLYQSMWTDQPMVHILPHWTHPGKEGMKIPVVVYTNCDEVELFLNGKSLGSQKYNDEQLLWMVPYEAGEIIAVAKRKGEIVAENGHKTAGNTSKIILTPDKTQIVANRTEVVHITVEITDDQDVFCPNAEKMLEFEINGPAKIIGVDNGDPIDLSDYKANKRRTFRGKVMLLIQATGQAGVIEVIAKSDNLNPANIKITSR